MCFAKRQRSKTARSQFVLIRKPNQRAAGGTVQAPADMTVDEALEMMKNAFTSAAERDVHTGDGARFIILTPEGPREEILPLRQD